MPYRTIDTHEQKRARIRAVCEGLGFTWTEDVRLEGDARNGWALRTIEGVHRLPLTCGAYTQRMALDRVESWIRL